MVVGSLAKLEQGELFILRGLERKLVGSSCGGLAIEEVVCSKVSNSPSRSAQNLEYFSFSAASSIATSTRLPLLLSA